MVLWLARALGLQRANASSRQGRRPSHSTTPSSARAPPPCRLLYCTGVPPRTGLFFSRVLYRGKRAAGGLEGKGGEEGKGLWWVRP